jgi:nucleoside-diphosphate-sugar epimerase
LKTVLITGAGGFIAGHLAKTLKLENIQTVGISRKATKIEGFDRVYNANLGDSLKPALDNEPIDCVVHCANHVGKNEFKINVNGTTRWLQETEQHGIKLQIFLSSMLAKADALSAYARAKFELEKKFLSINQVIYRPGLVVGNGGVFHKMKQSIQKYPVVPLLDKGQTKIYITGIDYLCQVIRDCILNDGRDRKGAIWRIHQPTAYTLKDVMTAIRRQFGYQCLFVPVPSFLVLWPILFLEKLPLFSLNIRSTSIKGLRQSGQAEFESDFDKFGYPEQSLDELIRRMKE